MTPDTPHILLVNPWIHDFAAYDFWAKPLGLLTLGALLRQHGFRVSLIDCLDRFHPRAAPQDPQIRFGRGPYLKTRIPKPPGLADLPRRYARYGILPEWLREDLAALPRPDLILVTSLMTYWYGGLQETIRAVKAVFPGVPLVLGGIYASLCSAHARATSGADRVVTGPGEAGLLQLAAALTGMAVRPRFDPEDLDSYPLPAHDLQRRIAYVPLLTSQGCPFTCAYCASSLLNPRRRLRSPTAVVDEIRHWHDGHGVRDFVFYDDALLVDAGRHAVPLLEKIIATGLRVRFHTPNALHVAGIDTLTAGLMFEAGVQTLRLGLETTHFDDRAALDRKVTAAEFARAVACLRQAGFRADQVGAYLLAGLPDQPLSALVESIATVKASGISPILAYYSPIPGTALWKRATEVSRYPLTADPVFTNNALWPCWETPFTWPTLSRLKNLSRGSASDQT